MLRNTGNLYSRWLRRRIMGEEGRVRTEMNLHKIEINMYFGISITIKTERY